MALPLPHVIVAQPETGAPVDPEAIQENFDALKKEFPLSRKNMKVETPHVVGNANEPAFQNGWVNYDTTAYHGARYWKDPMGVVHIEGLVKNGAAPPSTIFILPVGYRPGNALLFTVTANGLLARVDITTTGNVLWNGGGTNAYLSLAGITFKQEA